jgi:fructose-1-phosphate kinase PfkB-like protein
MLPAEGETRMATVLVDLAVNLQSTISAPTLTASEAHLDGLIESVCRHASGAWGLICGGSLPPGLPQDSYARLLRCARECGLVTLLDTSREALCQGVRGLPHVLKINLDELRALLSLGVGPGMPSPYDEAGLARLLAAHLGIWASEAIVVTLGHRGSLAVTAEASYVVHPPVVPVVNTAGAGDALDSGLMLARSQGRDWPAALALGTAAAASVVMNEGTALCRRKQVEELVTHVRVCKRTKD